MMSAVSIPQAEVAALCRRYHVERLALFGSVLRDRSVVALQFPGRLPCCKQTHYTYTLHE